jgi:hypothetical protein
MALTAIDLTQAIRTLAERVALIEAVANAPSTEPELDWIEWKSTLDLSLAKDQFNMARHVLGFANRNPDVAAAAVGGCAYLLVGVEPANLQGVSAIDVAKLSTAIDAYTGGAAGPRWSPDYIQVRGHTVLVVTVEAPAWGDPIHTLRQGFGNALPGLPFVRRLGKTEQANPQEMVMLTARASRRSPQIAISVRWAGVPPPVQAAGVTEDAVEQWVEREHDELIRHLEEYRAPDSSAAPVALAAAAFANSMFGEKRSAAEYRKVVDDYGAAARKGAAGRVYANALQRSQPIGVVITNGTDGNFSEVRCELKMGDGLWAVFDREAALERLLSKFPARPRPFGAINRDPFGTRGLSRLYNIGLPSVGRRTYRGRIDHSNSVTVTLDPVTVRPRDTVHLEPFFLLARPELAGSTIEVLWKATATNADGVAAGTLSLTVTPDVIGIESLTERRPPATPADEDPD